MTTIAAIVAVTLLGLLGLFQIALICGAPLGHMAWGGSHKVLPIKLRVGSFLSLVIYAGIALCLLTGAGILATATLDAFLTVTLWCIFAYLTFSVFINVMSKSKSEKYVMSTASIVLAVCTFIIAVG